MVSLMLKQPETNNQINRVTFLTTIFPMDFKLLVTVFFTVYAIINQYSYYWLLKTSLLQELLTLTYWDSFISVYNLKLYIIADIKMFLWE